jgi:hypothetical protein
MDTTLTQLMNSYKYYKQPNNTYIHPGRELEYYSYNLRTYKAVVPIIDKQTTYCTTIPPDTKKLVDFFTLHLENNKKYLHNI